MVKITFITADGSAHVVSAQPGQSVMESAIWNNVPGIEAECGGSMACSTCLVQVDDAWRDKLPAPSATERELVAEHRHAASASRLACQLRVVESLDGLTVRVPPEQR